MKKFLKDSLVKKYVFILLCISLIGLVGFLAPYGNERWNFIFENMIWLPFELLLTVIAINKIIELLEERRNKERFIRIAGKKVNYLSIHLKKKLVAIPINCQYYDEKRDIIKLYDDIVMDPKNFFDESLFTSTRKFLFSMNIEKEFNYFGIVYLQCLEIDKELKKFIERYELYFDDELFEVLSKFESLNSNFGMLNNSAEAGFSHIVQGDYEEMRKGAEEYLKEAKKVVDLLETFKREV